MRIKNQKRKPFPAPSMHGVRGVPNDRGVDDRDVYDG